MKPNSVFEAIAEQEVSLSKTHRKLADYIKKHYDTAVFMTARKLAEELQTSESTVVRFAMALGFDGYPEFQSHLRANVKGLLTTQQKLASHMEPESFEGSIRNSFTRDISDIRTTYEQMDFKTLKEMAKGIQEARGVYILAQRSSKVLADYLDFYLSFFHPNVHCFHHGAGDYYDQFINLTGEDAVIAISFPRYSKMTLELVDIIRAIDRIKIYGITDSHESPLNGKADLSIYGTYSIDFFIDSHVAPMALINALITAVAHGNLERTSKKLQQLEDLWENYHVYI